MGWSLDTKTEGDILVGTLCGAVNKADYLKARQELISAFRNAAGVRHILLDVREAVVTMSPSEIFEVASSSRDVIPMGARYALVFSSKTLSQSDIHFGENVAVNRGARLRGFSDIEKALEWLQGSPEPRTAWAVRSEE